MGKYTVTEVTCHAAYGCLAEYEVHLYANGGIDGNMMTVKSDIENIEDIKWPTITVTTNGFNEKDVANRMFAIMGRGSGKTQYALELAKAYSGYYYQFQPKKIIFNGPATIVLWNDGTKTVVKCQDGDTFDQEKGIALCFMKKSLGNKSNFNNIIKKYLEVNDGRQN